eukprot:1795717-Amphidinium_carterae.1
MSTTFALLAMEVVASQAKGLPVDTSPIESEDVQRARAVGTAKSGTDYVDKSLLAKAAVFHHCPHPMLPCTSCASASITIHVHILHYVLAPTQRAKQCGGWSFTRMVITPRSCASSSIYSQRSLLSTLPTSARRSISSACSGRPCMQSEHAAVAYMARRRSLAGVSGASSPADVSGA